MGDHVERRRALVAAAQLGDLAWPELQGAPADAAKAAIEREVPQLRVQVVSAGSPLTRDYRVDRVRLMADAAGCVVGVPRTG
jgi:hypothetical protein